MWETKRKAIPPPHTPQRREERGEEEGEYMRCLCGYGMVRSNGGRRVWLLQNGPCVTDQPRYGRRQTS
jgi:hypothetical protein